MLSSRLVVLHSLLVLLDVLDVLVLLLILLLLVSHALVSTLSDLDFLQLAVEEEVLPLCRSCSAV